MSFVKRIAILFLAFAVVIAIAGCAGGRATGDAKYPEYNYWWR